MCSIDGHDSKIFEMSRPVVASCGLMSTPMGCRA